MNACTVPSRSAALRTAAPVLRAADSQAYRRRVGTATAPKEEKRAQNKNRRGDKGVPRGCGKSGRGGRYILCLYRYRAAGLCVNVHAKSIAHAGKKNSVEAIRCEKEYELKAMFRLIAEYDYDTDIAVQHYCSSHRFKHYRNKQSVNILPPFNQLAIFL